MTDLSRVTPSGWYVEGKTPNYSHVTPSGWQSSNWTAGSETSADYLLIPGVGLVPDDNALLVPGAGIVQSDSKTTITIITSGQVKVSSSSICKVVSVARPNSDDIDGNWLPSIGSNLYSCIDEAILDSSDYIYTRTLSTCSVLLSEVTDPTIHTGHTVSYVAKGDNATDLVVRLKQGTTTIATWTETNIPNSEILYSHELTTNEASNITDYSNLKLEFESA